MTGAIAPTASLARSASKLFFGIAALALLAAACSLPPARVGVPAPAGVRASQSGIASWYGPGFHGKATASGVVYDQHEMTAAHQTLPLGTRVLVINLQNGAATELTINDRGPFAKGRILDLSYAAAQALGAVGPGTIPVRIEVIEGGPRRLQTIPASVDYTLQLGSFTQFENAQLLRERVAQNYADVSVVPVQAKDSTYFRVQLGTFVNRAAAEEQARLVGQAGFAVTIVEK